MELAAELPRDFVPLALDALDRAGVKLTFFVVGSDAANPRNAGLLRSHRRAGT